ncbi:hypothetical protein ABPG75_003685 [Micractinium tetrahymenae]
MQQARVAQLAALVAAGSGAVQDAPLLPSDTYTISDRSTVIIARSVWLGGTELRVAAGLPSAEACVQACSRDDACDWVDWCPLQGGCDDGSGPLPHQACRMLSGRAGNGSCTLSPPVVGASRGPPGGRAAGHRGLPSEGAPRAAPGVCGPPGAVDGTDGCSSELGVLKKSHATSSNSLMAPRALLLELAEPVKLVDEYILVPESSIQLPPPAELEAAILEPAAAGDQQNSTAWLGCFSAEAALLDGEVVDTLDGVESAEACCCACRRRGGAACNMGQHCQEDPECQAIIFKPVGAIVTDTTVGMFCHGDGANLSIAVRNPSAMLYWKDDTEDAAAPAGEASGGLPGGAIAGLAAGCAVVALAAAIAGWAVLLLRRRRRKEACPRAVARANDAKEAKEEGDSCFGSTTCTLPGTLGNAEQLAAALAQPPAPAVRRASARRSSSAAAAVLAGIRSSGELLSGRPLASPFASRAPATFQTTGSCRRRGTC